MASLLLGSRSADLCRAPTCNLSGCAPSHGRTWLRAQAGHLRHHCGLRVFDLGKLREKQTRGNLRGLHQDWQREGESVLPLVRLFFVGRGRAGKTTALRPCRLSCQLDTATYPQSLKVLGDECWLLNSRCQHILRLMPLKLATLQCAIPSAAQPSSTNIDDSSSFSSALQAVPTFSTALQRRRVPPTYQRGRAGRVPVPTSLNHRVGASIDPPLRLRLLRSGFLCFEGTSVSSTVQHERCLKGEAPKKDEESTHGMGLSGTDVQKAKHEFSTDGTHKPWNRHQSNQTLFEHCGVRGVQDLQKEGQLKSCRVFALSHAFF